ncbi:hypothetical protein DCS_05369 [Drechmeria coniospora]|uniref:tyrosinase n=1 Tax=Drechmeria coniospora TaxID=98403 RepID=A0A151GMN0_DRECN|nr:hypothetical protein DCS_05369 [Drechmeria coniospora]KYK58356.1 hypothetical protein DCS_05369 [Drechmeria coniospora]ODA83725.1 hypothetical protein RJ55_02240 [Drechmeria coniospora]
MLPTIATATALVLGLASPALGQNPYAITGVSVPRGWTPQLREDINDLQRAGGPKWDLYVQALSAMQESNAVDPLSYFQISGIHGMPYTQWNNTGAGIQGNSWMGYCPHGEDLFLPWHRPYVVLFEQSLVEAARRIALRYPAQDQPRYRAAAEQLRSPYWDWATDSRVPPVTTQQQLTINVTVNGAVQARSVRNPLWSYQMPQQALNGQFGTFDRRPNTIRCVGNGIRYPDTADMRLASRQFKSWSYDALTRARSFADFTSGASIGLENIHNAVHVDAACGNQFGNPNVAAFDPLFMLHHTNVDRLWAYWQAMNPSQDMFQNSYRGGARFSTPGGTTITSRSPLQPFYGNDRVVHTSESVRSIRSFNYAYRGLEYWNTNAEQMRQNAVRLINQMYGPVRSPPPMSGPPGPPGGPPGSVPVIEPVPKRRYFARISADREDLPRPCQIEIFYNNKRASSLAVLAIPETGKVAAGLPLDEALEADGVTELPVNEARARILKSLRIQVTKTDGTVAPTPEKLQLVLEEVMVTPPRSDADLPKFSSPILTPITPGEKPKA